MTERIDIKSKTIEELKKDAIEMLENDDELFVDMVKRARRIQRLR